MFTDILLWLFITCIAVQCAYALYFFTRIFTIPKPMPKTAGNKMPVSVIICAKNEAVNLEKNLPAILSQNYKDAGGNYLYEVLVVNDASNDNTGSILSELEKHHPHLRHVTIPPGEERKFKGKKFALSRGVETVNNEILLLTDADCMPVSNEWLPLMIRPLLNGKEIVCGYGAYAREKSFLNTFVRWETIHTFLQYSSYANAGIPYMGVGRNLACKRETLLKAQRSEMWNALPSGDDDLLVQACGTKENTEILAYKNSFTVSRAKNTWSDWFHQKQRHISTGKYYNPLTRYLLGFYALTHGLGWALFFLLLVVSDSMLILALFAMRSCLYWLIWETTATKLREKNILRWMPVCDLSWAIYNFAFAPYIFIKNKQQWK